jgi:hypothetical protein
MPHESVAVAERIGGGYGGYRGEAKCPNGTEHKKDQMSGDQVVPEAVV